MKTREEIVAEMDAKAEADFEKVAVKRVYGVELPDGLIARVTRSGSMTQVVLRSKEKNRKALMTTYRGERTWQVGGTYGIHEVSVNGPIYRKVRTFADAIYYAIGFCQKGY